MIKPQSVVFDLGKVLVDFDYSIASRRIAARGRIPAEAVQHYIDHSPLLYRYETGLIDREEFYREIVAFTGFAGNIDEFAALFADIFTPMDRMVELHARLRDAGVPTYIFSNTNDIAIGHIRGNFPFFSRFTGYVLSYEHQAMKPTASIYAVVERLTGHQGAEILYLDDRAENVEAGAARGWQVILQREIDASWAGVRQRGLIN